MEDKLVTLAIRTYQRAQMIKAVLEEEGIETVIHNLNLENPELAVGVRVRIKESDLPRALKIVEEMECAWEDEKPAKIRKTILIPVDFADLVPKTFEFGFQLAENISAEIVFLHIYFSPTFTISMNNDVSTYSISDGELLRRIISTANADVENMGNLLKKRIQKGELPNIHFHFELKEGVPEDQILDYCKKNKPDLVVMGSHGRKISNEFIGSVTAEVLESGDTTIFAIPETMRLNTLEEAKRIAFITNFDQKDLIAIDKVISTFDNPDLELFFIHASEKAQAWDEIMLAGIKTYFSNHYPQLKTSYALVESTDSPEKINKYVESAQIDVLAFNTRRKKLFRRIFNPGLAYKMIYHSSIPLFVTHV
jgi:nucleotide-binding universal stress UspA family protein